MSKLRPGRCYRELERPYTRVSIRNPRKSYVKGVPGLRISQFEMGKLRDYSHRAFLIAERACQIRHNTLEAARVMVVKTLEKRIKEFFVKLRVYPHHVLRENPLATGAGADRYQKGMRLSFGKPIGVAAQVDKGQILFEVRVDKPHVEIAKEALKKASYKLPTPCKITVEEIGA